jgi:spore maturation protein CgeB
LKAIKDDRFDVAWVDNGELISKSLVQELKFRSRFVLNLNLDNPYAGCDGRSWRLFQGALPEYDLVVTPRISSRDSALVGGARRAIVVWFAADETIHRPLDLSDADRKMLGSEVVFVGTFMPERGPFMRRLLDRGVPLRIFGPRWEKAAEYPRIRHAVTPRFQSDEAYVKIVSGAKIGLALLSEANQDLHTTRSLEIPSIGTLLCAPRTSDHEVLYRDGVEACFFDNVDECADICFSLLANDDRRRAIAAAGHRRALRNGRFNERVVVEILNELILGTAGECR